jgi:diacylglycerol kinase (ATP)
MTSSKNIPVILNGKAGRKSAMARGLENLLIRSPRAAREATWTRRQIEDAIVDGFRQEGLETTLHITRAPEHAGQIARALLDQGAQTIAVAGGDGTINEVVNALAETRAQLGIIPLGTANAFAMELGIPLSIGDSIRVIREGKTRTLDAGKANRHFFAMGAGLSYEAHVIKKITPGFKYLFGSLAYIFQGIAESLSYPFPLLKIRVTKPSPSDHTGTMAIIANARFYGGPFQAAPDARLDDGLLDVVIMKRRNLSDLLRYLSTMRYGNITRLPDVEYLRCQSLTIESDQPVPVHVDAEIKESTPCTFECVPGALRVVIPGETGSQHPS